MAQAGQTSPVAQGVTSTTTMLLEMSAPVESSATAPHSCFVQSMSARDREMGTMPTLHTCSQGNTLATQCQPTDGGSRPQPADDASCCSQSMSTQSREMSRCCVLTDTSRWICEGKSRAQEGIEGSHHTTAEDCCRKRQSVCQRLLDCCMSCCSKTS